MDKSPIGKWIALRSWDGFTWSGGSDILQGGGTEGSKGYEYDDVFNLGTGKRAAVFGGYLEIGNESRGFFQAPPGTAVLVGPALSRGRFHKWFALVHFLQPSARKEAEVKLFKDAHEFSQDAVLLFVGIEIPGGISGV